MNEDMVPMPAEDSQAIISLVQQAMNAIMKEAADRLFFPLQITLTCPLGSSRYPNC
jgi:hypothetical protein